MKNYELLRFIKIIIFHLFLITHCVSITKWSNQNELNPSHWKHKIVLGIFDTFSSFRIIQLWNYGTNYVLHILGIECKNIHISWSNQNIKILKHCFVHHTSKNQFRNFSEQYFINLEFRRNFWWKIWLFIFLLH